MAKNRKILVIGASPYQVPLILKAKKMGYTAYATSYLDDDPGLQVADNPCHVSILDFDGLVRLCRMESISRVATCASDLGILAVAHLNDALGFPGLTEEQVRSVSHKGRFAQLQRTLGLPCAESFQVHNREDLERALRHLSQFPVVLKPFFASGSRGVKVARTPEEAKKNHDVVLRSSFLEQGYIIQKYLSGKGHSAECLIEDHNVAFLELTEKFVNCNNVPVGHYVPVAIASDIKYSVKDEIEAIVRSIHVEHAALNIDVIIADGDVPVIIDFSFRLGGNLMPQIMEHKYKVDMFGWVVADCFRDELRTCLRGNEDPGCFASIIFGSLHPGVLTEDMNTRITAVFEKSTKLIDLTFDIAVGESFERFDKGANRFGHALFKVDSRDSYRRILESFDGIVDKHERATLTETL